MVYDLKRDPRQPNYEKRLPGLYEIKRETQIAEKLREDPTPKRLGARSRQLTLVMVMVGIATFVAPLIGTVPSVSGRTYWSPYEIFMGVTGNSLPAAVILNAEGTRDVHWLMLGNTVVFGAAFAYAMLATILVSVMGHASRRVVGSAAALGLLATLIEMRGFRDFQLAIFGGLPGSVGGQHVEGWTWSVVMFGVMALLLVIAAFRELDGEMPRRS